MSRRPSTSPVAGLTRRGCALRRCVGRWPTTGRTAGSSLSAGSPAGSRLGQSASELRFPLIRKWCTRLTSRSVSAGRTAPARGRSRCYIARASSAGCKRKCRRWQGSAGGTAVLMRGLCRNRPSTASRSNASLPNPVQSNLSNPAMLRQVQSERAEACIRRRRQILCGRRLVRAVVAEEEVGVPQVLILLLESGCPCEPVGEF